MRKCCPPYLWSPMFIFFCALWSFCFHMIFVPLFYFYLFFFNKTNFLYFFARIYKYEGVIIIIHPSLSSQTNRTSPPMHPPGSRPLHMLNRQPVFTMFEFFLISVNHIYSNMMCLCLCVALYMSVCVCAHVIYVCVCVYLISMRYVPRVWLYVHVSRCLCVCVLCVLSRVCIF